MNSGNKGDILIVDDEPNALKVLSLILTSEGYNVAEAKDAETAEKIIHERYLDAVIADFKLPGKNGMQLFEDLPDRYSDIPFIFLTAYGTVESAVSAMTHGVFYYFIKPPDYEKLKRVLLQAVCKRRLQSELDELRRHLPCEKKTQPFIARTPEMLHLVKVIESVKDSTSSVLVCGETGTGKELIAKALHFGGCRREKPFLAVNCSAIPRELMESELFGHEKGAFTGAVSKRLGRFEEASGGTILLDEIGELEVSMQAKLLRVLQEREVVRLGSNSRVSVDFRLVCSTNRDLEQEVMNKNFREDLFYRINVVRIDVPPLRERRDEIPFLVTEFLKEFCERNQKTLTVSDAVMNIFQEYHWPGNIRQLKNTVERAVLLSREKEITLKDVPVEMRSYTRKEQEPALPVETLKEVAMQVVMKTLRDCGGNKSRAARALGISRNALYRKLENGNIKDSLSY